MISGVLALLIKPKDIRRTIFICYSHDDTICKAHPLGNVGKFFEGWTLWEVCRLTQANALRADSLLLIDILHGLTVTSRAPKLGHPAPIFTTEFGRTYRHINDRFIDQVLCTANPTTVQVLLGRWTKGDIDAFPKRGLVVGLTDIVPS